LKNEWEGEEMGSVGRDRVRPRRRRINWVPVERKIKTTVGTKTPILEVKRETEQTYRLESSKLKRSKKKLA